MTGCPTSGKMSVRIWPSESTKPVNIAINATITTSGRDKAAKTRRIVSYLKLTCSLFARTAGCLSARRPIGGVRAIRSNAQQNRPSQTEPQTDAPAPHDRSEQVPPDSGPWLGRKPYGPPSLRPVCSQRPHAQRAPLPWLWQTAPAGFCLRAVHCFYWREQSRLERLRERECRQNP